MSTVLRNNTVYELLARTLEYPSEESLGSISSSIDFLSKEEPEAAEQLNKMHAVFKSSSVEVQQELYTRTFDVAPICVPYLTSYIFGPESFERGEVMSKLAGCFKNLGFDAGSELPDHIAVLMRFCAQLNDEEIRDLVRYCISRPLKDMVVILESAESPFQYPLIAFRDILLRRFPEEMRQ
jgi:nitrate reductase molybdenum cofactor assembly chaperone